MSTDSSRDTRVLLTGATGQVGQALLESADRSPVEIIPTTRASELPNDWVYLDLERGDTIDEVVPAVEPDWVLHAAAMTDVDACQADPALAERVNADATEKLARAAADIGARFLYVSTDYVFDGEHGPYSEDDETGPVNAYGRSKLLGEHRVRDAHPDPTIARTCVVFGPHRANYTTWAVEQLEAGEVVHAVEDQRITPTFTEDLSDQLLALVSADATGIFHTAGATACSRLEMTHAIAEVFALDVNLIEPCKRADLPWDAPRPRDTRLSTPRIRAHVEPWPLQEALVRMRERRDDGRWPTA